MLIKVSIILIFFIVLFTVIYACHKYRKINNDNKYRLKNEEIMINQLKLWESTYQNQEHYKKDELFSPARMKNGRIDADMLEIEVIDYTAQVPWFLRLREK